MLFSPAAQALEWTLAYDGFGKVERQKDFVRLAPQVSTRAEETHAALVLLSETERRPVRDFHVSFRYRVREQLRRPASAANAWETLWLFFNYQKDGGKKRTNYLILKGNGLEIGKAWGETEQSFAHTSAWPRVTDPSRWQDVEVERRGPTLLVTLNHGRPAVVRLARTDDLFAHPGSLGLYSEDADVEIQNFHVVR